MYKTLTATFDGQALWPESLLDLEPNMRYVITVEPAPSVDNEGDAWNLLETLVGALEAPSDWASEHDHYLYGTPKRQRRAAP